MNRKTIQGAVVVLGIFVAVMLFPRRSSPGGQSIPGQAVEGEKCNGLGWRWKWVNGKLVCGGDKWFWPW